MRLSLLIADDDAAIRRVVAVVADGERDLEVVGSATTADEAIQAAERLHPDVALVDVRMPGGGPRAAREIARRSPGTRIVAYSAFGDAANVREMLESGAVAYTVKGGTTDELLEAIRDAAARAPRRPRDPSPVSAAPEPGNGVRVVAVHPDAHMLEAIAEALDAAEGVALMGLAQAVSHGVSLTATHAAQVVLIPAGVGSARLAAELHDAAPDVAVIALSFVRDGGARTDPAAGARLDEESQLLLAHEIASTASRRGGKPGHLAVRLGAGEGGRAEEARELRVHRWLGEPVAIALQPILDLSPPGRIAGYEALSRFPATRTPDVCFADAHLCGLGVELELHAFEHATRRLDELPDAVFLSLNLSPESVLDRRLDALVADLPAERVVVEITEHAAVADYDVLGARLQMLRDRGIRVAVDDCGAGFASLRHVVLIAPDFLKLDVALCHDVRSPVRWAMARAISGFAAETGAIAIAEGIENDQDLAALIELGVPMAQGYLLGEPRVELPERHGAAQPPR